MHGQLRFAVIGVLIKGKKSGYDIIKDIEKESGWKPSYGSLYPLLDKLKSEGYVKSEKKGKKNLYALTFKGKMLLLSLKKNHGRFVSTLKKIFKVMDSITGEDFSGKLTPLLENLCTNYHEITKLEPELTQFNSAVFEAAKRKDIKKAKKVLKEATGKLTP
ncbi:MAG: PadR family transcriptional regulator [Candidatus Woesearchaeota archaeon]